MLSINTQRSPRPSLHPQSYPASRLHRSVTVQKLNLQPPIPTSPSPLRHSRSRRPSIATRLGVKPCIFPDDTPYPLSHNRNILTCDALDHAALTLLNKSCSSIDFTARGFFPRRCLDLGCGTGAWVLEAANEWPECEFIGFDLVDLQIPSHRLPPKYAKRIKWVQGNFLKPLPFENEYFDHIYIRHISRGVPEHKWDSIMAEVARVLAVGGSVEIFEEDIIFPVLPRSSTATSRPRKRKSSTTLLPLLTTQSSEPFTTHLSPVSECEHDHVILETLFYRVFERRFINLQPTALIMNTLNIHLRHAGGSRLINFPLPPASSLAQLPTHTGKSCDSSRSITPRMLDRQDKETVTYRSPTSVSERRNSDDDWQFSSTGSTSRSPTLCSQISTPATSVAASEAPTDGPAAFFSDTDLTSMPCGKGSSDILPEDRLMITSGTLGLHLYRSWQGVMACREAMWDEYQNALHMLDPVLDLLEWEDNEFRLPEQDKFDILMDRYRSDMEAHYPIADVLVSDLHWEAPLLDINKDDKATKQATVEARFDALRLERSGIHAVPEASRVCRKARIFIGRKGDVLV